MSSIILRETGLWCQRWNRFVSLCQLEKWNHKFNLP